MLLPLCLLDAFLGLIFLRCSLRILPLIFQSLLRSISDICQSGPLILSKWIRSSSVDLRSSSVLTPSSIFTYEG